MKTKTKIGNNKMKIVKINKSKYISPTPLKGNWDNRKKYTNITFQLDENEMINFTDFREKSDLIDIEKVWWTIQTIEEYNDWIKVGGFHPKGYEKKTIVIERNYNRIENKEVK